MPALHYRLNRRKIQEADERLLQAMDARRRSTSRAEHSASIPREYSAFTEYFTLRNPYIWAPFMAGATPAWAALKYIDELRGAPHASEPDFMRDVSAGYRGIWRGLMGGLE